jgi:gamma-glutamyltranspeptidase
VFERRIISLSPRLLLLLFLFALTARAEYIGSVSGSGTSPIQSAALEILGNGGGSGSFTYKGGGNAIDAAVASMLAACVISPDACSLGGYGGHMLIYKAGWDGSPRLVTCIDFNSPAGSLASSNMWVGSVDLGNGQWTNGTPNKHRLGWKAVGVPGTFAGLYMAQTNYGRKMDGTNYFPFAEIMKSTLSRIANGQVSGNAYYTLTAVSNLVMELYTNSNPYGAFYTGDIAQDIVAAMQTNGGLVTYADMTNYRPREVTPYARHFHPLNGTPATVYVAPPGSAGLSVLQEVAMLEAVGWTNGPSGTWDSLKYWQSRGEIARLMWKDHYQWIGDPWAGVLPPDILGNGSTNFCDQLLAHATNGYSLSPPWDTNEIRLTNSLAGTITQSVNNQTNAQILVHWDDIRYGTFHLSTSDKWGNCVSVTWSMGGGFGAQVAVPNRGLVFGQGMALFDPRPGWPDSIGPGKRPVNNMCPAIVIPDIPATPTNNAFSGGRPPFAVGGGGGSTIENNIAMQIIKFLTEPLSSPISDPALWLYNFEGNNIIYMQPSYPAGVQSYLTSAGYSAPGTPPSVGVTRFVAGWIPPEIVTQPIGTNVALGGMVQLTVTATGLPLFYQWYRDGVPLVEGALISGVNTRQLTMFSQANGAAYTVVITNGASSFTSSVATVTIAGKPVIVTQPKSRTNVIGTFTTFLVDAAGDAPLAYQWRKNGVNLADGGNISGAQTSGLNVNPVSVGDEGGYSVVVSNAVGVVTSAVATLTVVTSTVPQLAPLWGVSSSDAQPWFTLSGATGVPNQRTIAYNSLSNHLYVVSRSSNTTSNYVIHVLNATNGTLLYTLKTNGIQCNVGKGGIGLCGIGVADDGAIYACNEAPDAAGSVGADPTSFFRVYRWANANSNTSPSLVFSRDPTASSSAMRWGDNLTVRGLGTNTQLLLDMTYFGSSGSTGYVAILYPTNAFMTNFAARWFTSTNFATGVGRSIEFDSTNNAIWQKEAGKALYKTSFDSAVSLGGTHIGSSTVLVATNFPPGLMGIGLDSVRQLGAGVFSNSTTTADSLNLYDLADLDAPNLLAQYDFPTTPRVANGNRITQTFFKNDLVFTIDANNGIMVLRVVPGISEVIRITNFGRMPDGTFQFAYSNHSIQGLTVFATTNLVNWNAIGTATQVSPGWYQFTDSDATNMPYRFYQLRVP